MFPIYYRGFDKLSQLRAILVNQFIRRLINLFYLESTLCLLYQIKFISVFLFNTYFFSLLYKTRINQTTQMQISAQVFLFFTLLSLVVAVDSTPQPTKQGDVFVLDNTNLQSIIYGSQEPWLLDLYAPWCGHCMKMTDQWKKLATKLKGTVNVAKIDASQYPQFNQLYGLKGFPHIVFIPGGKKDKSVYYQHTGTRTAEAFQQWVEQKINQHKRSVLQRLTDKNKWEQRCLSFHSDFCTIFFLPAIQNSSEEQREFYLKLLNQLIKKFSRQPISWLWSEQGENPGIQSQFGLKDAFPYVVLVNPSGKRFSVMKKSFTEDDFTQWLRNAWDIEFQSYEGELKFGQQTSGNEVQPDSEQKDAQL